MKVDINITSEIGKLNGVILHRPGSEIESMTPENAHRALYSDILNLNVASKHYHSFESVLKKLTTTYQVVDLLTEVLKDDLLRQSMVADICKLERLPNTIENLIQGYTPEELSRGLIEGVRLEQNSLTNFLNEERYALRPLHNLFFTRDASVAINNSVYISRMASGVREREAMIMDTIFNNHERFNSQQTDCSTFHNSADNISYEGGDILIAREDILIIGCGSRTTSQGIDRIVDSVKTFGKKMTILVQELPHEPESFIHLDMVFTLLDRDQCMVFEPLILKSSRYKTINISIADGEVKQIKEERNLIDALSKLGMDLNPICCGGEKSDIYVQEREQWHSGTNFFAVAPGRVIGYGRNTHTIQALNNHGFEVITADDVVAEKIDPNHYKKYVITIEGSELARGGGGARCMTMPFNRDAVEW